MTYVILSWLLFTMVDGFYMSGTVGLATTTLSSAITDSQTNIPVGSTNGFPSSGTLYIDNEIVCYSSKASTTAFTASSRGCKETGGGSTKKDSHSSGTGVYNRDAWVLVEAGRYSVQQDLEDFSGKSIWGQIVSSPSFLLKSIPQWLTTDYNFLKQNSLGTYFRTFLQVLNTAIGLGLLFITFKAVRGS